MHRVRKGITVAVLSAAIAATGALGLSAAYAAGGDDSTPTVEEYRGGSKDQIEEASSPGATAPGSDQETVLGR